MYKADLNELVNLTRIPRAVLLCEAVDDLLEKHRAIWSRSRQHGVPSRCGGRRPIETQAKNARHLMRRNLRPAQPHPQVRVR